ncbi:hypothetical protein [Knoellia remsis]|uniref:hypothetical protein n=1 Tax=Knoellia remsis TaxID=407159 RepID=UPI003183E104
MVSVMVKTPTRTARTSPMPLLVSAAGLQADAPRDEQREEGGDRHDPEAADLDEAEDDGLPETAPVELGVDRRQPGHAHRTRRGEERRDEGRAAGAGTRAGDRQHEQEGPDEDGAAERSHDDLARMSEDPDRLGGARRAGRARAGEGGHRG